MSRDISSGSSHPVRVSLVIHTLNEEENIADCIASVGDFADEVLVCDMHSDDRTREIAESLGARVLLHKREPSVDTARPFAIQHARGEWIFTLDADERATPELLTELETHMQRDDIDAVMIRWRHMFMGKMLPHTNLSYMHFRRFFRRAAYLEHYQLIEQTKIFGDSLPSFPEPSRRAFARERFIHLAYPTLDKYTYKTLHNYSLLQAKRLFNDGMRPSISKLVAWPLRRFVGSYLLRLGFLDGVEGFIQSVVLAMFWFLVMAHLYDLEAGRIQGDAGLAWQVYQYNHRDDS